MNEYWLRRALIGVCAALALINGTAFLFFQSYDHTGIDFRVFWEAARQSTDLLYVSDGTNPFVYPPSSLLLFKPLALFDVGPAFVGWVALSLGAYFFAVNRACSLQVALVSMLSLTVVAAAKTGQVSLILSAAIVAAFTLPPLWCGVVLGAVLTIKPHLIILAPLAFLVRRDWVTLRGMTIGSLGVLAAELALFGPSLWVEWIRAIPTFQGTIQEWNLLRYMVTPAGMAEQHGLPGSPLLVAGAMLGCVAVLFLARKLEGAELAALLVGGSLLASPYALPHDMAAMIPACVASLWKRPSLGTISAMALYLAVLPGFALLFWMLAKLTPVLRRPLNHYAGRRGEPRTSGQVERAAG